MGSLEGMVGKPAPAPVAQNANLGENEKEKKKSSTDFGSEFSWVGRHTGGRRHVGLGREVSVEKS